MASKRLLITARSFGKVEPAHVAQLRDASFSVVEFRESPTMDKGALEAGLPEIETWVVSGYRIDDAVLAKGAGLRLIIKHGIGVDNIDIPAATRRNILVMNTPQVNPLAVADLAVTLLLSFTRRIVEAHQNVVSGKWVQLLGTGVYGKTLGIIGLGQIGLGVADRAKGFGMRLMGFDPYAEERVRKERNDIEMVAFEELLRGADFISLNVPLSEHTVGLIGRDALQLMKPGAIVVNTSRGKIVDETAMYEALSQNRIAGYATDVFENEPPVSSPLLTLPNVLCTPHFGWYTQESMKLLGDQVVASILSVYAGEAPANILNPEVLPTVPPDWWRAAV
jgi:D-3-phosphoglycerate dehydrogenase